MYEGICFSCAMIESEDEQLPEEDAEHDGTSVNKYGL